MKRLFLWLLFLVIFTSCAETPIEKKTVLVTGANRGLGLEFAKQFHARGYEVIATARKPEQAEDLKALGVKIEQLDVADEASVAALADRIQQPIDILLNNAAVIGDRSTGLMETSIDNWRRTFEVNSIGPVRVFKALYPNLMKSNHRQVINISSRMGSIQGVEKGGYYDYRASKAALNMFNQVLAAEFGKQDFTFVVLHPGWTKTDMGGANASFTPEESVLNLVRIIDKLSTEDNGKFFGNEGEILPW